MRLDEHDPSLSFALHEALVETYHHCRVLSGELPAEKIGTTWRLPRKTVDILGNLWRAQRRRSSCAA
jgi:hypothetical protein